MNWDDLAAKIAAMTPEERKGPVRYAEPYDECVFHDCGLSKATDDMEDTDGNTINKGEYYLD